MIIFIIIIIVWSFSGVLMGVHAKDNKINYYGLFFLLLVPFIPIIAKILL